MINVGEPAPPGYGSFGRAEDTNNSLVAAGWLCHAGRAFMRDLQHNTWSDLPYLQGTDWSGAFAINDAGIAVGHSGMRAVAWGFGGQPQALLGAIPTATSSIARDINDASQVVGECTIDGVQKAWTWDPLHGSSLLPDYGYGSVAYGVNGVGGTGGSQIVGIVYNEDGSTSAILWAIPEPATALALLCGLGGLAVFVRSRRQR